MTSAACSLSQPGKLVFAALFTPAIPHLRDVLARHSRAGGAIAALYYSLVHDTDGRFCNQFKRLFDGRDIDQALSTFFSELQFQHQQVAFVEEEKRFTPHQMRIVKTTPEQVESSQTNFVFQGNMMLLSVIVGGQTYARIRQGWVSCWGPSGLLPTMVSGVFVLGQILSAPRQDPVYFFYSRQFRGTFPDV